MLKKLWNIMLSSNCKTNFYNKTSQAEADGRMLCIIGHL